MSSGQFRPSLLQYGLTRAGVMNWGPRLDPAHRQKNVWHRFFFLNFHSLPRSRNWEISDQIWISGFWWKSRSGNSWPVSWWPQCAGGGGGDGGAFFTWLASLFNPPAWPCGHWHLYTPCFSGHCLGRAFLGMKLMARADLCDLFLKG